jgi:hypothetical protein
MGLVESYIKLLERKYDGMTVELLPSNQPLRFKFVWDLFGTKECSVGFEEMELALSIPDTLDGLIYPLFRDEMNRMKKMINRKEVIDKIIKQ